MHSDFFLAMLTNSREGELIDQETGTSLKKIQKEKGKIMDCFPSQAFNYTYYVFYSFFWYSAYAMALYYKFKRAKFLIAMNNVSSEFTWRSS